MRRAALVLLAVPLAVAACGGGGGGSSTTTATVSSAAAVKAAAVKTATKQSEHLTMKANASAGGQSFVLDGSGDFDAKRRAGSFHVDLTAGPLTGSFDEVLDRTDLYLKSPLFGALLPQGKSWLKLDLERLGKSNGLDLSALLSQNPAHALGALRSLKGAKVVGKEQLDGVSTTHYRVRTAGASRTYDVWVGDDGYVRRFRTSLGGAQKTSATVTVDLSDFGKPVTVTVPPASDTFTTTTIPGLGG